MPTGCSLSMNQCAGGKPSMVCIYIHAVFYVTVAPLKVLSIEKLISARLGVSRTIYVHVDSPNLGFPYFNF